MKVIIGVSDMKVSDNPDETLITYSLGSCIGVIVYDPEAKAGGMLHYMLPDSTIDKVKAEKNPFMFADTGIPNLFKSTYKLGAKKNRMRVVIAGGSQILDQKGFFNIGKRNHTSLRKMFFKNNVITDYEDIGGNVNRTIRLDIATGDVYIKTSGKGEAKV
ncbi:MAG: chemotaxis protein CheD [Desulfobacterales bacterium]|nr:chemotaxis protein CheD [Desulfobacterales bacterium]MCP4162331.1 chemotaxis protein CheD [Deltaproteobacteria bacterium]